jgi:hypothetical protein
LDLKSDNKIKMNLLQEVNSESAVGTRLQEYPNRNESLPRPVLKEVHKLLSPQTLQNGGAAFMYGT